MSAKIEFFWKKSNRCSGFVSAALMAMPAVSIGLYQFFECRNVEE
jgi:hypothetical protein